MLKDVYNPLCVFATALAAITTAVVLQEADVDWIHSVWVVMAVSVLVDLESSESLRLVRLMKKIVALFLGLLIGTVAGLIVLGLNSWESPRWIIVFIRILVATTLPFGCALLLRSEKVRSHVDANLLGLLCAFAALPLFVSSGSLAMARVVAVLFACAVAAVVALAFSLLRPLILGQRDQSPLKAILADHSALFSKTISLCAAALKGVESEKENFLLTSTQASLGVDAMTAGISFLGKNKELENVAANLKPVLFDANALFWSAAAPSSVPFTRSTADPYPFFTGSEGQFHETFSPALVKVENGIELIRSELLLVLNENENLNYTVSRLVNEAVGYFLVAGLQALEFKFAQFGATAIFPSMGQRWAMCAYLTNLAAMLVSLTGLVKTVIDSAGLGDEYPELSSSLVDSMNKISN